MYKSKIGFLSITLSLLITHTLPSFLAAADEVEEVVAIGTRRDAR